MIFETERLLIRKLKITDIDAFHEMQNNINVMRYTDSPIKNLEENIADLNRVIAFYNKPKNDFWVFAVIRKSDNSFLGTIALIKDEEENNEIGYRFLEKYWNKGYAYESIVGLLKYAKKTGKTELVAMVIVDNIASEYILKKTGFTFVKEYICESLNLLERLYKIKL